jgi:hypothetical protein
VPEIVLLDKEQYKGYAIPFDYTTDSYFDLRLTKGPRGFRLPLLSFPLASPCQRASRTGSTRITGRTRGPTACSIRPG